MLELGAGAIVGIVIAVLFLLTLVAVVLFARAKGRWCFAGKFTFPFIINKVFYYRLMNTICLVPGLKI